MKRFKIKPREFKTILFLVLVFFSAVPVFAQTRQIKGTVTEKTGEPLIGATVIEKGTLNGTITDLDGNFTIYVQDKAVIQVSFIPSRSR